LDLENIFYKPSQPFNTFINVHKKGFEEEG